ncbi:hypothetical protein Ciccas_007602 [Cichlidogyrus casuarinus]|uniref:Tyrosine-protein kinase n=1 Tax=Cichlidogyrus casuarinus TaxID=1844966 RepID=A0ABD2Q2F0_9PLAT
MNADPELKVSRMEKRSTGKLFGRGVFKLREFVLTPQSIKYYEANGGNRGKERGCILLSSVKYVEKVMNDALEGRKNVFQLAHLDENPVQNCGLNITYIIAGNSNERDDWLSLIRFYARERDASFFANYHPGVWVKNSHYTCCDASFERAQGCQATSLPEPLKPQSKRSSNVIPPNPALLDTAYRTNGVANQLNYNQMLLMLQNQNLINAMNLQPQTPHQNSNSQSQVNISNIVQQIVQPKPVGNATNSRSSFSAQRNGNATDPDNVVIAIHNYNPLPKNQLKLQKGERYFIVDQSNSQWWYVRNSAGQAGYVPTNYIHKPNSLDAYDWYYKGITRQQAEAILLEEQREGCFLVRDSVSKKNTFTLSVTSKDPEMAGKFKVHHYLILRTSGAAQENGTVNGDQTLYYLSKKHAFPSIEEVVHYHRHNSGGLVVRLRSHPTKDRESPVTAGLGLDEFELDLDELQIEKEEIGKGQFGVVKLGTFRQIRVAVKQMVEGAMNEDDFIEEAKNMR